MGRERQARFLASAGFVVEAVGSIFELLTQVGSRGAADAVVIELPSSRAAAVETMRRVRGAQGAVPVLALTASEELDDRVAVLDAGADDVVSTRCPPPELGARLRAVLRRSSMPRGRGVLRFADLELDRSSRRGRRGGSEFTLTRTEFELLELLLQNPERVLPRSFIFEHVWGYELEFSSNSLEVYISALRRKTERGGLPRLIQTVRGVGYVLRAD